MKILIACEMSGIVRRAFQAKGHKVTSVDLQESEDASPDHKIGCVRPFLVEPWDLVIAFPPCTYLSKAGLHWNRKRPERWKNTLEAMQFVDDIWNANSSHVVIENPPGFLNSHWKPPNQTIQPWMFGEEKSKPISLWLKNVPPLVPTQIVSKGEFYVKANGHRMAKWAQCPGRWSKEKKRRHKSRFFPGIAAAMASQWESLVCQIPLFCDELVTSSGP